MMTTIAKLEVGDRVKVAEKFNARSTDPITGERVDLQDSFRLIKRGILGTITAITGPVGDLFPGVDYVVVKLDGINTPQADRSDNLKKVAS